MEKWSRGRVLHMHEPNAIQFLTWRLADSLPATLLAELHEKKKLNNSLSLEYQIDEALGNGHGECHLKNPHLARTVMEELLNYNLHSFVVMPNHVHAVIRLDESQTLPNLMKAIKRRTSLKINKALGRQGTLWQKEYFDRIVREEKDLEAVNRYVEWNPVKAGLVDDPREFAFSSAFPPIQEKLLLRRQQT